MIQLADLPPGIALATGILVLCGAALACIGSAGLLRLDSFYRRVHAPTLGTTLGMYLVLAGTMVFFWAGGHEAAPHVILIGIGVTLAAPIALMLLARAALERDRRRGSPHVPRAPDDPGPDPRPPDR